MPTNPWDSDYKSNDLKEWHIATHGLTTKHTRHHHHLRLDQVKLKFWNAENSHPKWMNPSNRCVFCTPNKCFWKFKITTNHTGMGVGPEGSIISYWETQFAWISPYPHPPQKKTPTFCVFFQLLAAFEHDPPLISERPPVDMSLSPVDRHLDQRQWGPHKSKWKCGRSKSKARPALFPFSVCQTKN